LPYNERSLLSQGLSIPPSRGFQISEAARDEEFLPNLAAHQVSRQDTLHVGDRTFGMRFLKSVHSEADTAIWMPKKRIVFAAASVGVKPFSKDMEKYYILLLERVNAMVKQGEIARGDQKRFAHAGSRRLARQGPLPEQHRGGL
jgi:hypothetical protein